MQSGKKTTIDTPDPSRIRKVAEILGLMEESQKNKEWIFQQLKAKRIKNPAKRAMNSYQILNMVSDEALSALHKTLTAKDVDELTDINSLTKTYHWFFTDIVAGSNPNIVTLEQARKIVVLNELIERTETYKHHDKNSTVILPTGDGMAIGFADSPEYPLRLAIQLHKELFKYNKTRKGKEKLLLRIGIDTGPVYVVKDLTGNDNVWGPGIIMTRRVMDLAGDMNIFASSRYGEDIRSLSPEYKEIMHPIGDYSIKHGEQLHLYNIYGEGFGNKLAPKKSKIMQKHESFEQELERKVAFLFNTIDVRLEVEDPKTMLTHHTWIWNLINQSNTPRDQIFYYLDGDVAKDFPDMNVRVTDEEENELEILSLSENKPTHKEFNVQMKKPIKPKQRNRFVKLEYDWEEPERNFFYKLPTDCKRFTYEFFIPRGVDVKNRVLKVDTELGYKWVADPPPVIKYLKEGTKITWEGKNLKAFDAYKFEW